MAQYIDKDAVIAEIRRLLKSSEAYLTYHPDGKLAHSFRQEVDVLCELLSYIDTLEVMDLEFVTGWFDHIAQIADNRMTLTGQRMTDSHALDEIKCIAKDSSQFITKYYKGINYDTERKRITP